MSFISNQKTEEDVLNALDKLPIFPKSEIFYLTAENENNNKIRIQEMYRIGVGTPLIAIDFGLIINDTFYDLRKSQVTSRRRMDLRGYNFMASMVVTNNDTIIHLTDHR